MAEPCYAPVFEPRSPLECFLRAVRFAVLLPLLIIFSWIPAVYCVLLRLRFEVQRCRLGNRERDLDLRFSPNEWIAGNNLSSEVIWQELNGALRPHSVWSRAERSELARAFWKARLDEDLGIPETPLEATPSATGRSVGTAYPRSLAWRIFIAHLAQSIAVEHGRWVPWTLTSLSRQERAVFLDGRSFFAPSGGLYDTRVREGERITYGDPVRTFRFVRELGPLGPDALSVIHRLLEWAHANMIHFQGSGGDRANYLAHWGYEGHPPVSVIIRGSIHTETGRFAHWSAGCWGLTAFLRAVLRTANIGVAQHIGGGHSQPHFLRDERFLSHGDDPYNALTFTDPPYPMSLLPIDRAQHTAWYGPSVDPDDANANVGRRTTELAIDHVTSRYVMAARCRDIAAGRPHATSEVFGIFSRYYTVPQLEARTLWDRIDAAIAARGGCGSI